MSHPNVDGGHPADISFLTAAPHPASSSFRNTISLDQYAAQYIGHLTRFPTLTLGVDATTAPSRPYPTYFRLATTDLLQGPFGAQYLVEKSGKNRLHLDLVPADGALGRPAAPRRQGVGGHRRR